MGDGGRIVAKPSGPVAQPEPVAAPPAPDPAAAAPAPAAPPVVDNEAAREAARNLSAASANAARPTPALPKRKDKDALATIGVGLRGTEYLERVGRAGIPSESRSVPGLTVTVDIDAWKKTGQLGPIQFSLMPEVQVGFSYQEVKGKYVGQPGATAPGSRPQSASTPQGGSASAPSGTPQTPGSSTGHETPSMPPGGSPPPMSGVSVAGAMTGVSVAGDGLVPPGTAAGSESSSTPQGGVVPSGTPTTSGAVPPQGPIGVPGPSQSGQASASPSGSSGSAPTAEQIEKHIERYHERFINIYARVGGRAAAEVEWGKVKVGLTAAILAQFSYQQHEVLADKEIRDPANNHFESRVTVMQRREGAVGLVASAGAQASVATSGGPIKALTLRVEWQLQGASDVARALPAAQFGQGTSPHPVISILGTF